MQKAFFSRLVRAAFWIALLVTLALAFAPVEWTIGILSDRAQHLVAFFVLAALGVANWGRRSALTIGVALAALGGAIEIVQATPLIGRDAEIMDWLADVAGILLALAPAVIVGRAR